MRRSRGSVTTTEETAGETARIVSIHAGRVSVIALRMLAALRFGDTSDPNQVGTLRYEVSQLAEIVHHVREEGPLPVAARSLLRTALDATGAVLGAVSDGRWNGAAFDAAEGACERLVRAREEFACRFELDPDQVEPI